MVSRKCVQTRTVESSSSRDLGSGNSARDSVVFQSALSNTGRFIRLTARLISPLTRLSIVVDKGNGSLTAEAIGRRAKASYLKYDYSIVII